MERAIRRSLLPRSVMSFMKNRWRAASQPRQCRALLASGSFFWIDLPQPMAEDFAVLRDVFQFHPLALEDSEHFGQRAKLDDYDDFVFSSSTAPYPTRTGWSRCTTSIPSASSSSTGMRRRP